MVPSGPAVPMVCEIDDRASCIIWPAARVLLQWLRTTLKESLGSELEGSTILELGAGTGFLSLALAQEGVRKVFAAEGDEDAWENLTQNVGTASQVQPVLWNWEKIQRYLMKYLFILFISSWGPIWCIRGTTTSVLWQS